MPYDSIQGKDINMILDMLDGGAYTTQGGSAVAGSQAGGGGTGQPPNIGGVPVVGGNSYPGTPTGLGGYSGIDNLAVVNNGYVQLSWAANPGNDFVMEYDIQYRKGADSNYAYQKVPGGYTAVKIPGLFPGFTYQFSIRSVNGNNYSSPWSREVGIAVTADTTAPATPTNLAAYATPHGAFLSWNSNTEADLQGYLLQYSLDGGTTWNQINSVPYLGGAFSWLNPNTPNASNSNVSVKFRIAAEDFSGNSSAYSAAVTATTGGLSFSELLVGNLTALGTITAAGAGLTTRVGQTGAGVDIVQGGITGYQSNGTQTFKLDATNGNLTIAGNAAISGATNTATITAGAIQTNANVLTAGGVLMDGSGIQMVANGTGSITAGTKVWYANINGQFLSAQWIPVYTGYQPCDGPGGIDASAKFEITSDFQKIVKVTVSFYMDTFRVGQQSTATGTTSYGSSSNHSHNISTTTSSSTSAHSHSVLSGMSPDPADSGLLQSMLWSFADGTSVVVNSSNTGAGIHSSSSEASHSHNVNAPTASGQTADHNHTIPNLGVQAPTGLYSGARADSVYFTIRNANNTILYTSPTYRNGGNGGNDFQTDIDVTSTFTTNGTGWYNIVFHSGTLGAIEGQLNIKAIIQSI